MKKDKFVELFATLISVGLVKSVAILVLLRVVPSFTADEYASWIYNFQIVIVITGILSSSANTSLAKKFVASRKIIRLFLDKYDIGLVILLAVSQLYMTRTDSYIMYVVYILILIFDFLFAYSLMYLRWTKDWLSLVIFSSLKAIVFGLGIFVLPTRLDVVFSIYLVASVIPFFFLFFRDYRFVIAVPLGLLERGRLIIYGIGMTMLSGFDKLYLTSRYVGMKHVTTLVYLVSIVGLFSIFQDIMKKIFGPRLYADLKLTNVYKPQTMKYLKKASIILLIVLSVGPLAALKLINTLELVPSYVNSDGMYLGVLLLSIPFAVGSIYHFMTPFFLQNNRSLSLLWVQLGSLLLFVVLLSFWNQGHYTLFLARGILYLSPLILASVIVYQGKYK